ncbi:MAG: glycosyltransferase [Caulobacteraceae bacterium]|nr:glycosyltransferase [Caulobacteraceae bacterium]
MISIITPTHSKKNLPYLLELYNSIVQQTYTHWEWVVYVNGELELADIPKTISSNHKVKLFIEHSDNKNIGYIKKRAFGLAIGSILLEADHDDILTPDCLANVYEAFLNSDIGFVYSNTALYETRDRFFVPFNASYGWTHSLYKYKNLDLYSMNAFEPTSHSLSFIWYAPDHVRAWRKETYTLVGGHNPGLSVCDDHELLIRTYLKTKFKKINKTLYIYRKTNDNTTIQRNDVIQYKTVDLFNTYARKLAERDCELNGLLKVDLGGGINPLPGYTTIDLKNSDIIHDLNCGIPLEMNSVGIINASHIIEHLYDKTKIMSEIHRVLAHGGWAFIDVPSTDGRGAFQDPTHVSYWNENSFLYYTDRYFGKFIDNTSIRFQQYRLETHYPNDWFKNMYIPVVTAWLVANKEGGIRLPGNLHI